MNDRPKGSTKAPHAGTCCGTRGGGGGARPASRMPATGVPTHGIPNLGLVCITVGPDVRYRTITRTRLLSLPAAEQASTLAALYRDNLRTLWKAVDYCAASGVRLYRVTSNLFPQIDTLTAGPIFDALAPDMAGFGQHAAEHGVRVLIHPDQFVVLNSESPKVATASVKIMTEHATVFDRLGLPESPWACMILHGGKGGRADELVAAVAGLPGNVRHRLVLENDESAYGAEHILRVCRRAGVPMVFDAHHHVVREKLDGYDHPSVRQFTEASRDTWPDPAWHLVHVSNGSAAFGDSKHSELIVDFPDAYRDVPWVEVEAKGKEQAIDSLRLQLLLGRSSRTLPAP
jgi:UV DNA damage endonuclease